MQKATLLIAFILCFTGTSHSQFFKKLGKKVEKAAERTIVRKSERKATKETEKAFDSTFNRKTRKRKGINIPKTSSVTPAHSYSFNHKVKIQMTTKKEVLDITYYLPNRGNYLCAQVHDKRMNGDFYTVFDVDQETMFTYMENEGKKIKMAVSLQTNEMESSKYVITATGNSKTILGYNCVEYKMKGEDMTATIWVTKDVTIRFPSDFYKVNQKDNTNQEWMREIDGWAMEMTMIDTSKRKPQTIVMHCLSIEQSDFEINSNEYQSLGY